MHRRHEFTRKLFIYPGYLFSSTSESGMSTVNMLGSMAEYRPPVTLYAEHAASALSGHLPPLDAWIPPVLELNG